MLCSTVTAKAARYKRSHLLPESSQTRPRDSEMPSQYLLLHLQAVWLHPEAPPGLHSCAEGPGKSPSLRWSRWPALGSSQRGAGRAVCSSQGSESGQGRAGAEITCAGVSQVRKAKECPFLCTCPCSGEYHNQREEWSISNWEDVGLG